MTPNFNADRHEYRVDGVRYPSVTEILSGLGLVRDLSFLDDFYRQRGSAVHRAIDLHFQGLETDWDFEGAEHVRPRFERFLRLVDSAKLRPIFWESPLVSATYGYAGMPDYVGPYGRHPIAILDWKGDSFEPGHRLQVSGGYRGLLHEAALAGEIAVDPDEVLMAPAFLVPLGGEASLPSVSEAPFDDGAPLDLFRAAASIYNGRLAHNLGDRNASAAS